MKKISKSAVIINALTEELPVNETWYQKRLAICDGCEQNSANAGGVKGIKNNLIKIAGGLLGVEEPQCNACGCFITKKASQKEEECGMASLGLKPLWPRLMVNTIGKDFNIYNNNPEKINIDANEHFYLITYIEPQNNNSNTSIQILVEGEMNINKIRVGCGCTTPTFLKISNGLYQVNVSINMNKVALGDFQKDMYIDYDGGTASFKLKGIKQKL